MIESPQRPDKCLRSEFSKWGELVADDEILAMLKQARNRSGLPLDFWDELTRGLDYKAIAMLCARCDLFPKYMKSSVRE